MTEFESAELAASIMGNFLASFTVLLSIVTAYVVAAFVAGRKLTRFQLIIVNVCFIASFIAIGWLSIIMLSRAAFLVQNSSSDIPTLLPTISLEGVIFALYVVLFAGSLSFMVNIRNSDVADDY